MDLSLDLDLNLNMKSLILMLHTNQLPYKRLNAGDFIYELAPKKIGFNHKISIPDTLRDLLGDNISINIITLTDEMSLVHSLLSAIMPKKYEQHNWYYRKVLVEHFATAINERLGCVFAKSPVLMGTTLKQTDIEFDRLNSAPSPELLLYICLVLNINLVIYVTGMINRTDYYYPTGKYDVSLPLILLHMDDKRIYSIITVNDQSVFSGDTYTAIQVSKGAPTKHPVLCKYVGAKCPIGLYASLNGLSAESTFKREKTVELLKLKISELKELAIRLSIRIEGRATKQVLAERLAELAWLKKSQH